MRMSSARYAPARSSAWLWWEGHYCLPGGLGRKKTNQTSVKIEVGCRDDTMPKTVDTRRHCEVDLRALTPSAPTD